MVNIGVKDELQTSDLRGDTNLLIVTSKSLFLEGRRGRKRGREGGKKEEEGMEGEKKGEERREGETHTQRQRERKHTL